MNNKITKVSFALLLAIELCYSTIATGATAPDAPINVTASGGDQQATVTFTAPSNSGSSAIAGYTVISAPSDGVDSNAGTNSLSHVITGLKNGTPYTFTVTATNEEKSTSIVSAASNSVTPSSVQNMSAQPPSASSGTWKYASGNIMRRAPNNMPAFVDSKTKTTSYAPVGTIYDPTDTSGDILTVRIRKVGDAEDTALYPNSPIAEGYKVKTGYEYKVSNSALNNDVYTNGVIAGLLVVPFKYHFVDHSLSTGNTSIGPYVGSEYGTSNLKISYFLSLGINFFSVPDQANPQTSTDLTGVSYAFGVAINSFDTAKMMYVCGQDVVSGSTPTPYQYDGKWWCMVGFGYALR